MRETESLVLVINDLSRYFAARDMWEVTAHLTKAIQVAQQSFGEKEHDGNSEIVATLSVVVEAALNLAHATGRSDVANTLECIDLRTTDPTGTNNVVPFPETTRRLSYRKR